MQFLLKEGCHFRKVIIYELGPWLTQAVRQNSSHNIVWLFGPIRGLVHRWCPSRNFAWHPSSKRFMKNHTASQLVHRFVLVLLKTNHFIRYNETNTFHGTTFSIVMFSPKEFEGFPWTLLFRGDTWDNDSGQGGSKTPALLIRDIYQSS